MTVAGHTTVSYTYDDANRLTGITQGTASVSFGYDDANRRTSVTLPNGIVVESAYDDDSQLTGLTYKLSGVAIGDLAYGYDASGRRVSVGGSYARTGLPAALTSATYDDANQIATWAGTNLTYDANGNLTSDGTKAYTWNARNELTALSGGVSASFAYDAVGRRRSRAIGSATTQFLYDGLNPVQELASGTPSANLLTGLDIDEYFNRTDGAGARHFLSDVLGSSVALTDSAGSVQTEYTYEPFGSVMTSGTSSANTFGFTARENDGTGLNFYRARYYDPRLQRFLSQDPIGLSAGPNLYAYVQNDPIAWADPLGLQAVNRGKNAWWVKREADEGIECVAPGATYPHPIDGLASPGSPRPGDVLKTPDNTVVVIQPDGTPAVYTALPMYLPPFGFVPPIRLPVGGIPDVSDRLPGWKGEDFRRRHPDWAPLFDASAPTAGRKPPENCPAK